METKNNSEVNDSKFIKLIEEMKAINDKLDDIQLSALSNKTNNWSSWSGLLVAFGLELLFLFLIYNFK